MSAGAPRAPRAPGATVAARGLVSGLVAALVMLGSAVGVRALTEVTTETGQLVAQAPADSGAWYCPVDVREGETALLTVAGLGPLDSTVRLEQFVDGALQEAGTIEVAAGATVEREIEGAVGGVVLRWEGAPTVAGWQIGEERRASASCAASPSPVWHLAGLDTAGGAQSLLRLFNPFETDAVASVVFATPGGPVPLQRTTDLLVPAGQTLRLQVGDFLPEEPDLGLVVRVRTGRLIAIGEVAGVVRGGGAQPGRSLLPAAPEPALVSAVAQARVDEVNTSELTVLNPADEPAQVEVRVTDPVAGAGAGGDGEDGGDGGDGGAVTVPAGALVRVALEDLSTAPEFAVTVASLTDVAVVAAVETRFAGGSAPGTAVALATAPETQWAVVGSPPAGEEAVLSLAVPGPRPVEIDARAGGSQLGDEATVVVPNGRDELSLPPPEGEARLGGLVRLVADEPFVPGVLVLGGEPAQADYRVAVPSRAWSGPARRPPVRRDPALGTRPLGDEGDTAATDS